MGRFGQRFARRALAAAALACAAAGAARAQEAPAHPPAHAAPPAASLPLTPGLRAALVEEMQAVQRETQAIVAAIPFADWTAVERAAERIRASYILERELGPEERAALERALPEGFALLDARFHADAGRLAEAARAARAEVVVFYASRLLDGCVSCHARYAAPRFPGFGPRTAAPHAH